MLKAGLEKAQNLLFVFLSRSTPRNKNPHFGKGGAAEPHLLSQNGGFISCLALAVLRYFPIQWGMWDRLSAPRFLPIKQERSMR